MKCGFVITQDHPDENSIAGYYESDAYLSHNDGTIGLADSLYRISRKLMLKRKRNLVKNFTGLESGRLLDIGSGTGHFLSEMRTAGWEISGIEINDKARQYSKTENHIEAIHPGYISSLQSQTIDCVTLWHVLEHLQDPFEYMSEIKRLLKRGGSCIIALPNCASFDAGHYKEYWAAYDVPRHLWHFTPESFKLFADVTGFEIKSVKRLPLDVFYISVLSEKYKGSGMYFLKGITKGLWFSVRSLFNINGTSSLIYMIRVK